MSNGSEIVHSDVWFLATPRSKVFFNITLSDWWRVAHGLSGLSLMSNTHRQ